MVSRRLPRDRQREILRRVVEEYVASGQPVGSKNLVDARGHARVAVDRPGRAGRARAPRPAHASAHVRGTRPDGGGLSLLRRRACSSASSRGPSPFPLDLAAARSEVEAALQETTETLSQATRLLALVSAPPLQAAHRAARRSAAAAAAGRDGRHDHVHRRRVEARSSHFDGAGRLRARALGGRVPERAARRARSSAPACCAGGSRTRASPRASARSSTRPPAGLHRARARGDQRLFVGGAAGLLGDVRAEELDAYRSLFELLEQRAAPARGARRDARLAPAVRPRRRRARAARRCDDIALVGASYGLVDRDARRGQPARPAPDGLREGDRRRSARPPHELSRFVESSTKTTTAPRYAWPRWRRRSATTTSCSASRAAPTRREIKKAFRRLARELHPDVSDAPDAEERFSEVVEAYEVLSKPETRRALRPLRPRGPAQRRLPARRTFDFGSLADLFSAFFGDDVFGVGGGARRGARRRPRGRGRDRARRGGARVSRARCRSRSPSPATRCGGDGAEPGTSVATCPTCGGAGRLQQVLAQRLRRVRPHAGVPALRRLRPHRSSTPCDECDGAGRVVEERTLDVEIPPGIHDGQRIRLARRGPRRRARRRAPATSTSSSASGPTRASCARATTSSRPST